MELLKFCIENYSFISQFAFRKIWFGNQLVIIWRRKTDYVLGLNEAHIKPNSRFEMVTQTNFRHINSYADQLFWNLRLMPLMQPNRGVGIVKIIGSHLFQLNSSSRTFFPPPFASTCSYLSWPRRLLCSHLGEHEQRAPHGLSKAVNLFFICTVTRLDLSSV